MTTELEDWQIPTGCRYIFGDTDTKHWFYCQKPVQPGGTPGNAICPPYCQEHADLCISPTFRMSRKLLNYLCALDSNVRAQYGSGGDEPNDLYDLMVGETARFDCGQTGSERHGQDAKFGVG